MSFSSLEINPELMRESYSDQFGDPSDWSDSQLIALKQDIAKDRLKLDMQLNYDTLSDSEIDKYIDNFKATFERMLLELQLYYHWISEGGHEGEQNWVRQKLHLKNYNSIWQTASNYTFGSDSVIFHNVARG